MRHEGGHLLSGSDGTAWVGPVNEGSSIRLSCRVRGGRPSPSVSWWRGNTQIPAEQSYRRSLRSTREQMDEEKSLVRTVDDSDEEYYDDVFISTSPSKIERIKFSRSSKKHTRSVDYPKWISESKSIHKRESGKTQSHNRWWDSIKVPDTEGKEFNYTTFIQGNIKYTNQYADQYGPYDATKFYVSAPSPSEPTAESVQTKPAAYSPQADILSSANYDKDVMVQSDVTVKATRDLLGATLYCRSSQNTHDGPKNLLEPMAMAVSFNITRKNAPYFCCISKCIKRYNNNHYFIFVDIWNM